MVIIWPHMRAGALGGLGSGILAALLEVALLLPEDRGPRLALALSGLILSAFFAAGALLGLALGLVRLAGRWLAKTTGHLAREDSLSAALLAVAALFPVFLMLSAMAGGRKAGLILGPLLVRLPLTAAGAALAGLVSWSALSWGRRLAGPQGSRAGALATGLPLLGLATALLLLDALAYRRLYEYLHRALLLGYLGAGLLAALCLARTTGGPLPAGRSCRGMLRLRRRYRAIISAAGAVLLLGMGLGARHVLALDQQLRFVALELTTVSSRILGLLPLETGAEAPQFLDTPPGHDHDTGMYQVPGANVVLVSLDALRSDHLGTHGYGRTTSPNIDALATRSVRFEWAYCQAPLTCYSVPSLHTGDYLRSTLPLLAKPPPTLAQILSAHGYTTAAFYNASIFFCDDKRATSYGDRHFGFTYTETLLRNADPLTDKILAYLKEHRRQERRKLFLWVHFFDIHEPYETWPDLNFGPRAVDRYDSEIAYVDRAVGRLLAALSQIEGPTLFILTSDHGEEFKEHGGNYHGSSLYEEQIRIPLLFGVPGLRPRVSRVPVQLVDVVPTVLSLLGIRVPESVRGRSLVPELLGQDDPDSAAFSEVHTKKMVRNGSLKLIHDYRRGTYELYDLGVDPAERTNLIGRRPREVARLKGLLHGWFDRLRGIEGQLDVERPEGIDLGRIGDRRATPLLTQLLTDPDQLSRWRSEAATLLGQLQDSGAAESLWLAAADDDARVAREAAIALGEIKDPRARLVLPPVVQSTDIDTRMRASIAMARVDSPEATMALIETLFSNNWELQNRAVHYLGFVGDARATDPLLGMARHPHLVSRICLALGRLGRRVRDRRILPFLLEQAQRATHADVRQRAVAGLGYLGDRQAIGPLARMLAQDPERPWIPETLSRLGGLGSYWAPGLDLSPSRRGIRWGLGECFQSQETSSESYLGSTWCATSSSTALLELELKRRPFAARLLLRLRALNAALAGRSLTLVVNGRSLPPFQVSSVWQTIHLRTAARHWRQGKNRIQLRLELPPPLRSRPPRKLLGLDYLVLVPEPRPAKKRAMR